MKFNNNSKAFLSMEQNILTTYDFFFRILVLENLDLGIVKSSDSHLRSCVFPWVYSVQA